MAKEAVDPTKIGFSGREKGLVAVCVIAIIAAIAGFALFAISQPPASAAAKVNDTYIQEADVASLISQYRTANDLTDDNTFASTLYAQSTSITQFRQTFIDQLVTQKVVDDRAQALGVVPTDEEIEEQLQAAKSSSSFGSDEIWQAQLESYGLTEDSLRRSYKTSLEENAIFEKDVIKPTATDSQTLAYIQTYMAEVSQKHAYRIMFASGTSDDVRAACEAELKALKEAGTLTTDTFIEVAKKYSTESTFSTTNGALGWAAEITDEELAEILDGLSVGEYSDQNGITADDAIEIVYCDTIYTFPGTDEIADVQKSDVPSTLWSVIADYTSEALWATNCSTYLDYLVAQASVTYYPVPKDAAYNIDYSTITAQ